MKEVFSQALAEPEKTKRNMSRLHNAVHKNVAWIGEYAKHNVLSPEDITVRSSLTCYYCKGFTLETPSKNALFIENIISTIIRTFLC